MEGPYPGEKLSDRDRAALAKDYAREAQQTYDMAHRQMLTDRQNGVGNPIVEAGKEIARKIENGEIESR